MALLARSQPHTSGVDTFRSLAGPCTCECGENCKANSLTQNENAVVQISHPKRCVNPPPPLCVQTTPAANALLLVQFFWTSQQCEQHIFSLADPQQSSQSQRTFFVIKRSREITLQTSAIDVYKCRKTICVLH